MNLNRENHFETIGENRWESALRRFFIPDNYRLMFLTILHFLPAVGHRLEDFGLASQSRHVEVVQCYRLKSAQGKQPFLRAQFLQEMCEKFENSRHDSRH